MDVECGGHIIQVSPGWTRSAGEIHIIQVSPEWTWSAGVVYSNPGYPRVDKYCEVHIIQVRPG